MLQNKLVAATQWSETELPDNIAAMYRKSLDKIHSTTRTFTDSVVIYTDCWSTEEVACFVVLCSHLGIPPELRKHGNEVSYDSDSE